MADTEIKNEKQEAFLNEYINRLAKQINDKNLENILLDSKLSIETKEKMQLGEFLYDEKMKVSELQELAKNNGQHLEELTNQNEFLVARVASLEEQIKTLSKEVSTKNSEIADLKSKNSSSEDKEKELLKKEIEMLERKIKKIKQGQEEIVNGGGTETEEVGNK